MAVNRSLVDGTFSSTIFINFQHKFSIGFRFAGHDIEFICLSVKKALIPFALWQDALLSWKMTLSSPNQFSIDRMKKIIWDFNVLIVQEMIAISPSTLNDMQPHIMNDLGNLLVFFRQTSLYIYIYIFEHAKHEKREYTYTAWNNETI